MHIFKKKNMLSFKCVPETYAQHKRAEPALTLRILSQAEADEIEEMTKKPMPMLIKLVNTGNPKETITAPITGITSVGVILGHPIMAFHWPAIPIDKGGSGIAASKLDEPPEKVAT